MEAYKLGNVFDNHIDRDAYLKSPMAFVQECSECPARYYCAGSCRYDNAASTGSVFKPPEEMCRLRRRGFELSAYLSSRLDGLVFRKGGVKLYWVYVLIKLRIRGINLRQA